MWLLIKGDKSIQGLMAKIFIRVLCLTLLNIVYREKTNHDRNQFDIFIVLISTLLANIFQLLFKS